ncbi:hypothetical protein [Nannocystis pusilla]|uniref:hypothetical protein n=1 Tax=Nannocystis pusilla TaxID=889268 RepID=UPI003B7DC8FF
MTDRTYKVGDVVAWAEVPDGALVFDPGDENWPEPAYALRRAGRGRWVHEAHVTDWTLELEDWPWQTGAEQGQGAKGVTLVALNLSGDESADALCRLAEQLINGTKRGWSGFWWRSPPSTRAIEQGRASNYSRCGTSSRTTRPPAAYWRTTSPIFMRIRSRCCSGTSGRCMPPRG